MAISKHAYILNRDNVAVIDDGTSSGVVLVGKGGTITEEMAARHGVEVCTAEEHAAEVQAVEARRLADLEYARTHLGALTITPSGQVTDKPAVDSARQTNDAAAGKAPALTPPPSDV